MALVTASNDSHPAQPFGAGRAERFEHGLRSQIHIAGLMRSQPFYSRRHMMAVLRSLALTDLTTPIIIIN
jgi:hypothetical protein